MRTIAHSLPPSFVEQPKRVLNLNYIAAMKPQSALRACVASAVFCNVGIVHAMPLECAEDRRTNAHFCFAPSELKEVDGIRTAPLYKGGPKEVVATPFTIAANCATSVLHLKDRQGVSFAGSGPGQGTEHSRQLRQIVCTAEVPARRKKR